MGNKEKETPQETFTRLRFDLLDGFQLCEKFHSERLKIEAPTDEEINEEYPERTDSGSRLDCNICRREGAKWMRKLLTGV